MSSKTTATTTGTQSGSQAYDNRSTYDWMDSPGSEDITALRDYKEQLDPSIGAAHSRRQTNLRSSFQNPLGANTTPAMRDAILRSQEGELEQDYGQAQRQGYNDMQERTGTRRAMLAGLTAPTLTQTGSSGTGTSSGTNSGTNSQSTPMLPSILGGAMGVGAAALSLAVLFVPYIFFATGAQN